jgi:hypothetical protein
MRREIDLLYKTGMPSYGTATITMPYMACSWGSTEEAKQVMAAGTKHAENLGAVSRACYLDGSTHLAYSTPRYHSCTPGYVHHFPQIPLQSLEGVCPKSGAVCGICFCSERLMSRDPKLGTGIPMSRVEPLIRRCAWKHESGDD